MWYDSRGALHPGNEPRAKEWKPRPYVAPVKIDHYCADCGKLVQFHTKINGVKYCITCCHAHHVALPVTHSPELIADLQDALGL